MAIEHSTISAPAFSAYTGKKQNIRYLYPRLYHIWKGMRNRCLRPSQPSYKHYGGRGIRICEAWNRFRPFMEWSLAHGYSDDLSIDRIDPNGHYEPENCRWASWIVQSRNKRQHRWLTYQGQTFPVSEWAERLAIRPNILCARLDAGWTIEEAFFTPRILGRKLQRKQRQWTAYGVTQSLPEWAEQYSLRLRTLHSRLKRGWSLERALSIPEEEGKQFMSTSRFITFNGVTRQLSAWADHLGIPRNTLRSRLFILHWSVERALTEPVRPRRK